MATIRQQIINALTVGAIYALIALGYTMVYGVLRLIISPTAKCLPPAPSWRSRPPASWVGLPAIPGLPCWPG
jgi:hypothetical protein